MEKIIFNEFVEQVLTSSDIVVVVSEYVSLKKKGTKYWGCCPFHNEKTPSFSVSPDKGLFYCFGCQVGGNVASFISKYENISWFEAIKLLAQKANIPLPEKEKTSEEIAREKEMHRLWNVQDLAKDFFYACLTKTNYGIEAKNYLFGRGIGQNIIDEFKLGFAPNAWDKLSRAFKKRGISDLLLVKSGLAAERKNEGVYDRFRNRVIFPIIDEKNHVVGFGGRVLDDSQPKYLNSPETVIFNKRNILFGLHLAREHIKKERCAIVVEGYMDAVTAHSNGIKNVVASLGTAFTKQQAKRLLRYAEKILFAYDSDAAGQSATVRALSIVRNLGAEVSVISIPDGKDPDEFIRKHGAEAFRKLADHALPLLDYQVDKALRDYDYTTLDGKVAVVADVVPVLAETDNAVEVNAYIAKISQTLGIDESAVRSEIQKYLQKNKQDNNVKKGQAIEMNTIVQRVDSAALGAERHIIRLLWEDNNIIPYVEAQLQIDEFKNKDHREIMQFLSDVHKKGQSTSDIGISLNLSDSANNELSRCLLNEFEDSDNVQLVDDCIKSIHLAHLKDLYEKHRLRADQLERMGDEGFLQELAESQRIKYEINKMYD